MKKVLFLSFIFIFLLCGCSLKQTYVANVHQSLVSAIGFSESGEDITVYLEAVTVNAEDLGGEKQLSVIEGKGKTVYQAVSRTKNKASQGLELSHCAVIVIDSSISPARFEEILEFCGNEREITLSAAAVYTENSSSLLSLKPASSIAIGYDIISMLEQQTLSGGIIYKNRFYEIEALKEKPLNTFSLPLLEVYEEEYLVKGLSLFSDYKIVTSLNNSQSQFYSILTDSYGKGEIFINNKRYKINSSSVKYNFKYNNNLKIHLTLDIDSPDLPKEKLKQELLKEFRNSKLFNTDIYAFGNLLAFFNSKIWNRVETNYISYYKNSLLSVEFK